VLVKIEGLCDITSFLCCFTLKTTALYPFETSETIYQSTRRHILKGLIVHI